MTDRDVKTATLEVVSGLNIRPATVEEVEDIEAAARTEPTRIELAALRFSKTDPSNREVLDVYLDSQAREPGNTKATRELLEAARDLLNAAAEL